MDTKNIKEKSSPSRRTEDTSIGPVTIVTNGDSVIGLTVGDSGGENSSCEQEDSLLDEAFEQLNEYLSGERRIFSFPIDPPGSPFQRRVWGATGLIPYGETRSCKQIASLLGDPGSYRDVDEALRANPVSILIPSHRVTSGSGSCSKSDDVQERLLALEQDSAACCCNPVTETG